MLCKLLSMSFMSKRCKKGPMTQIVLCHCIHMTYFWVGLLKLFSAAFPLPFVLKETSSFHLLHQCFGLGQCTSCPLVKQLPIHDTQGKLGAKGTAYFIKDGDSFLLAGWTCLESIVTPEFVAVAIGFSYHYLLIGQLLGMLSLTEEVDT